MNNWPKKPCRFCGNMGHWSYQCYKNPKQRETNNRVKTKREKQWLKLRQTWFRLNPPNDQGYYECYICHRWLTPVQTTLDHVLSRSLHPDLVFDLSNLQPCCYVCNNKKGSKDGNVSMVS